MARRHRLRWAIVGVGVAGRARARAIEHDERSVLVSVWRGRFAHEIEAPEAESLQAAIDAVDCVAICSPSELHAAQVGQALAARRHVVVEYPLAHDAGTARALLDQARGIGRVLHVEHIEVLGAIPQTLRALVRPAVIEQVEVRFERGGPADIEPADIARGNVARLHRLVDVAGPVRSVDAIRGEPGKLAADLTLASGARAHAVFQQGPYFTRRTQLRAVTAEAVWEQKNDSLTRDGTPQTLLGTGPLFDIDQRVATARILDGAEAYVPEERILHVLEITDRLARGATGALSPP